MEIKTAYPVPQLLFVRSEPLKLLFLGVWFHMTPTITFFGGRHNIIHIVVLCMLSTWPHKMLYRVLEVQKETRDQMEYLERLTVCSVTKKFENYCATITRE